LTNEEIISSGLLEAYLTDDLSDEQCAVVEAHLKNASERKEYTIIQQKLEALALAGAIAPDQDVRYRTLMKLVTKGSVKGRMIYYLAASISLALLSMASAFYFYSKYTDTNDQLLSLESQNREMADNILQVNTRMEGMRQDLSVLINPAYTRVVMNSTQSGLIHQAVIYFNPSEQKVYLNSSTLPELNEGQQYQLWALIDGQPIDAGTFEVVKDEFQQMRSFEQADAFAVTIEPKGGSTSPTLEKMQVYGEVRI
jgi:hypothetical protein